MKIHHTIKCSSGNQISVPKPWNDLYRKANVWDFEDQGLSSDDMKRPDIFDDYPGLIFLGWATGINYDYTEILEKFGWELLPIVKEEGTGYSYLVQISNNGQDLIELDYSKVENAIEYFIYK